MSVDKSKGEENKNNKSLSQIADESSAEDALQVIETIKTIDPQLFHGLSNAKRQSLQRSLALGLTIQKTHSGPLPDPDTLNSYNKIIDNGAERIMRMAEKEQEARLSQHAYVARRMINQAGTGQILGFIICILAIGGGIYLSAIGKDTAGIATIVTALVTLAAAFLYTKIKEKKE